MFTEPFIRMMEGSLPADQYEYMEAFQMTMEALMELPEDIAELAKVTDNQLLIAQNTIDRVALALFGLAAISDEKVMVRFAESFPDEAASLKLAIS